MAAPGDAVESLPRWGVIASPDVAFDCSGSPRPDAGVVFLLRLVVGASPDVAFDCSGSPRPGSAGVFLLRWAVVAYPDVAFDYSGSARPDAVVLSAAGVVFLLRSIVVVYPAAMDCSVETRPGSAVALCLHDFVSTCFLHWTVISFLLRWAAKAFRPR